MTDKPELAEKQRHAIVTLLNAGEDRQVVAELLNLERELQPWLEKEEAKDNGHYQPSDVRVD